MPSSKQRRKRSSQSHNKNDLPWKKLDVGLGGRSNDNDGDDKHVASSFMMAKNHYDDNDDKTFNAQMDLEALPQEDMAMFVGLEVLDPCDYQVSSEGKLVVMKEREEASDAKNEQEASTSETRKGQKKRQVDEHSKEEEGKIGPPAKKAKKDKKKQSKKNKDADTNEPISCQSDTQQQEELQSLQLSWMTATGGVVLHQDICRALLAQSFWTPTPIQLYSLAPAILGRRNIVGAAPTGSGKTLAYLLPILEYLMELQSKEEQAPSERTAKLPLQAIILTPTRELALQVSRECQKLHSSSNICGVIVGGLARVKQTRVLEQRRPPILVATPGRLWELMATMEYDHLTDLSQLRYLVIDEADRMLQQGSFRELVRIFDAIHRANPMDDDDDDDEDEKEARSVDEDGMGAGDRLLGLPGVPGEAKVQMLDDVLKLMKHQRREANEEPEPVEMDDAEYEELQREQQEAMLSDDEGDELSLPAAPSVKRQTFVFSATLTLPPSASYVAQRKITKKTKGAKKAVTVEGAIAELLDKSKAHGPTKIVDLTSSKKDSNSTLDRPAQGASAVARVSSSPRLPDGLSLYKIECTKHHKDSHLYAYLVTTAQGASGPCLVFCNSIAAVHRVSATLRTLRLPVRALHANMPQKARFKAVESLRDSKSRAIVVATDVAARGLDIPSVATVVHYDVARQVDTFIHRAGRTARGVGENAVGASLSLVSSDEDKAHDKVCDALDSRKLFQAVAIDGRLLSAAQERTNLGSKIVACDEVESRTKKKNDWFQHAAEEAGLDLDEDLIDEGLAGGDRREQQQLQEAQRAKTRLRELLAQPMQTQRFGKFLSSNTAASALETAPYVVPTTHPRKKKRKKIGKRK